MKPESKSFGSVSCVNTEKMHDNTTADLIDREAAIDMLKNRWKKTRHYEGIGDDIAEECELYLKQVPSAQPSVSKEEMVGDTISRQAAIKAICEDGTMLERQGKYTMTMAERKQKDADILDSLPSAQPERMRGKWIIKDNPGTGWYRVTCSECGEDVTSTAPCIGFYPNAKVTWDYCPNCGADMREVDDE